MKHHDARSFIGEELANYGLSGSLDGLPGRARFTRWSRKQPGFGMRIYSSGRRVYVVQGNWRGRTETITIGNAAIIGERLALDIARRCLYIASGAPAPADERKRKRQAPLFQDFLNEYWRRVSPSWKPSTLKSENEYRSAYLSKMFPDKGIEEITREDMAKWMIDATRSGAPGATNRAFSRVHAIFNKAIEWGYRPEGSNPCIGVKRNKMSKAERFLSPNEFALLGAAIERHRAEKPLHAAALTLLVLTGCRRSEITRLRWGEVKGSRLYLADTKTGARTVQLPSHATRILSQLPRRRPDSHVFDVGNGKSIRLDKFWNAIRRETGLHNVRLHDLRHSFASHAARLALPLPISQRLLGHLCVESTARYTHFNDGHLFDIANGISKLIDEAMVRELESY